MNTTVGRRLDLLMAATMLTCGSASAPSPKKLDEASANLDRLTKNLEVCDHGGHNREIDADPEWQDLFGMICSVDINTGRATRPTYLPNPINKAREEAMSER
ncbi:hypothetical protein [Mesorhizobium japonicum]|uniref:Mll6469 protein n=1 Tax=Mesorhizobium japonicum (strain LMG 29417 / CECT 9101 / MAFF 303099) TaxID=266835 RepID=Q989D8_RHILO|nr:hypothetical protein [Mesorhizobium japonicum]BAB52759.1 mll6469 [Mesorhizobium japonicum MAFF 303099]